MRKLLKFVARIILGMTAAAAVAAYTRNGMENTRNINIFPRDTRAK